MGGLHISPRTWSVRVGFLMAFGVGMVLLAAYSARLIASITIKQHSLPFTSLEGLLKIETHRLGVHKDSAEYNVLKSAKNGTLQSIFTTRMTREPQDYPIDVLSGLERICADRNLRMMQNSGLMSKLYAKSFHALKREDSLSNTSVDVQSAAPIFTLLSIGMITGSQQIGEPELTFVQKRKIAEDLLSKNSGQFLARFGQFLEPQHLKCFDITNEDGMDYEVQYYLKQLQRFHNKSKMRVVIKNRRYEALKKLVNEGTYFSDEEMKKRNPLLYDRLVGCYLSGLEIHDQHLQAMSNIKRSVGGIEEDADNLDKSKAHKNQRMISRKERELLRDEFVTSMYQSFLDGKDVDFDYSTVDENPAFDCLNVEDQDEEEKYFDSETPEEAHSIEDIMEELQDTPRRAGVLEKEPVDTLNRVDALEKESNVQIIADELEEEDDLDRFMRELKPEPTQSGLAIQFEELSTSTVVTSSLN
uniref:(California timema) hypothetical protein n=1 Tax=Timema californicum TaxID=61474 RepID=A0A7R9PAG6_TIMCA|nr:unnamed protein product [Timema californicum]